MTTKVLAIDDDPSMTELLAMLLKSHGFDAITANNGNHGIQLTRTYSPDVIILDLMMQKKDGWEICQELRSFCTTPIIILSALDNPGMVASALDAGADDYLIKPVPSGVLIAHINNLTRRANAEHRGMDMRQHNSTHIQTNPLQA